MTDSLKEKNRGNIRCNLFLITGFLGSGKTTLLRHILNWPGDLAGTALIVNEFGPVGIDGQLLQDSSVPFVELTNGCICCTLQTNLLRTIEELLKNIQPQRIFIETTGIADPFDIVCNLTDSPLSSKLAPPLVVTVFDAELWEAKDCFGPVFYNQIRAADLFVLNKIDLLPQEMIPKYLEEIRTVNTCCSIIPTTFGRLDPEDLWTMSLNLEKDYSPQGKWMNFSISSTSEIGYSTFSFENEAPFDDPCFFRFIEGLPADVYRLKGFIRLKSKRLFINRVRERTDWTELDLLGPTKLTFIGRPLDGEKLISQLKTCLIKD
jgi:G3E family GTPase